jgi:hypothetical protein
MPCPHLDSCPIFRLFTLQDSLRVWKIHFCEGRFESCERLRLARAGRPVPRDLLPNGRTMDLDGGRR